MKRSLGLLVGMVALLVLAHSTAFARITVVYNGRVLRVSPAPIERDSRVLIGMRDIFEAMHCSVEWKSSTQTVIATRGGTVVRLQIGNHTAHVNGNAVHLDVPPMLIRNSTYVPLRFVAESTGAQVSWIAARETVEITDRGGGGGHPGGGGGHPGGGGGGSARLDPPVIIVPNDGATVSADVEIRGRATPGGSVRIEATAHRRSDGELLRTMATITRRVGADRDWQCALSLPPIRNVNPERLYWRIRVWAVVGGRESEATVIKVYK